MLRLLEKVGRTEVEVARFKVWDFYVLFPFALGSIQLPQAARRIRSMAQQLENRYEVLQDHRRAFLRLEPIQNAALAHLSALGFINGDRLLDGCVARTGTPFPEPLLDLIRQRNAADEELLRFLTTTFMDLPLYGKGGVRVRTDLFDHRYDRP